MAPVEGEVGCFVGLKDRGIEDGFSNGSND